MFLEKKDISTTERTLAELFKEKWNLLKGNLRRKVKIFEEIKG